LNERKGPQNRRKWLRNSKRSRSPTN
jgi:hypothetical protein